MTILKGKGVSAGIAIGKLKYYDRKGMAERSDSPIITEAEEGRFNNAVNAAAKELKSLAGSLREDGQESAALLMEAHAEMAEDPDFSEAVILIIKEKKITAEEAVEEAGEKFVGAFASMDNPEMKVRAYDVRDVVNRLINIMSGKNSYIELDGACVLASDNLTPSETASLDKEKIQALVLSEGSSEGHTAILARSFGIPAVVGLSGELLSCCSNASVIVDGKSGEVILEPDLKTIEKYEKAVEEQKHSAEELESYRGLPDATAKGKTIKLYCNIKSPDEVSEVLKNDAHGIGLFRTEFLFLGREAAPSEEEQFNAYKKVLTEIFPGEAVIRTLDIGSDKKASYINQTWEENPALGLRGIRLCLENKELFRTQLRALYRASAFGNLLIMLPMVSGAEEVIEAKAMCEAVIRELKSEGVKVADAVPFGIMIETPAAALISDELAKIVDFFSCGTNDLTQYTLACDRTNGQLDRYYNSGHRAVLEILRITTKNAHKEGIWVGVCGEAAADTELTEALVAMGIDELSVSPGFVLPVRRKIRSLNV